MITEYLVLFGINMSMALITFFLGKNIGVEIGYKKGVEVGVMQGLNLRPETVDELELRSLRDMRGFLEKAVCRLHVENVQMRGFISPHQLQQMKQESERKALETEKLMRHDVK